MQADSFLRNKSWFDENIKEPAVEAALVDIYQPLKNSINTLSNSLAHKQVLPELQVTPQEQASTAGEYCARLLSRGAVGAITYSLCGAAAGGLLRGAGRIAHLEGKAASLLASQSTGQIVGAGVHDLFLDAADSRERSGNVLAGASTFALFEACNRSMARRNGLLRAAALIPTGALGGSTGYIIRETISGRSLDSRCLAQASLDAAAMNLLLPAAHRASAKVIDTINIKAGRGMPLSRYTDYYQLQGKSQTLDALLKDHPLTRVQPQENGGAYINHRRDLIYMPKQLSSAEQSGPVLAHELAHKKAWIQAENEFEHAAGLLELNEAAALSTFTKARLRQEELARKYEGKTELEFKAEQAESKQGWTEREKAFYLQKFKSEFEDFRKSAGRWRPEKDNALLSSEQLAGLKSKDNPEEIVASLYPELRDFEKAGLSQVLSDWKSQKLHAGEQANSSAFELLYGMSRKAWQKSLAWSTVTLYAHARLHGRSGRLSRELESDPLAKKWTSDFNSTIEQAQQKKDRANQKLINAALEPLKEMAVSVEQARSAAKERLSQLDSDYLDKKQEAENTRDKEISNAREKFGLASPQNFEPTKKVLNPNPPSPLQFGTFFERIGLAHEGIHKQRGNTPNKNTTNNSSASAESQNPLVSRYLETCEPLFRISKDYPGLVDNEIGNIIAPVKAQLEQIVKAESIPESIWHTKKSIGLEHQKLVSEPLAYDNYDYRRTHMRNLILRAGMQAAHFDNALGEASGMIYGTGPVGELNLGHLAQANSQASLLARKMTDHQAPAAVMQVKNMTKKHTGQSNPSVNEKKTSFSSRNDLNAALTAAREKHDSSVSKLKENYLQEYRQIRSEWTESLNNSREVFKNKVREPLAEHERNIKNIDGSLQKDIEFLVKKAVSIHSDSPISLSIENPLATRLMRRALSNTLIFGKDTEKWNLGRLSTNLDRGPDKPFAMHAQNKDPRLAALLIENKNGSMTESRALARTWAKLSPELKAESESQPYAQFKTQIEAQLRYPDASHMGLASESAKWSLPAARYNAMEKRFLKSLSIPEYFPTETYFSDGKYSGRFLERSDVRRLFIGEHTNSCMRMQGANESGIWWVQESPKGGIFVVENQAGEIVAGSRVWHVPESNGVCFNSIQTKGAGERASSILKIYQKAARHLLESKQLNAVTVGSNSKINLNGLPYNEHFLPAPNGSGHLDCNIQITLADN